MNGWSPKTVTKFGLAALGASVTDSAISEEFPLYSQGASEALVVKIKSSAATVGAGITAKLQTAVDDDWVDSKTAAITVAGNVYIKLLATAAGDQTFLPLLAKGRIVITTGAGSSITISKIQVIQEL